MCINCTFCYKSIKLKISKIRNNVLKTLNKLTYDFFKARVPIGRPILELPAGMLDDNVGDIAGTAIREVSNFLSSNYSLF